VRIALALAAGLALAARADPIRTYRLEQGAAGPGIEVSLHYTFGTHDDHVTRALGEVRFDPDAPGTMNGALRVPIDDLRSDSAERDCHMREALGLDYARSRYPGEHVCEHDAIPKGELAYPEIVLEVHAATAPSVAMLGVGKEVPIELAAAWTIHGVRRPARLQLTVSRDAKTPGAVRIRGSSQIRLADFGIVVKSAKVLFVTSSVDETATVRFDLKLAPQ
jgi:polyisoprenoid-binding protein YceI